MKHYSIIVLVLFVTLVMTIDAKPVHYPAEDLLSEVMYETAKRIEERYEDVVLSDTGISMPGGVVRELRLVFDTRGPFVKDHIRKLLIEFAYELRDQINLDEEVRPHLSTYPFTVENVQIVINNENREGKTVFDPEIGMANMTSGILNYYTYDPEALYCRYKNRARETYEEALDILLNNKFSCN